MNRFSNMLLVSSGLLAVSIVAHAQGPYPQRDDPYYRNDGNRWYNDDGRFQQRGYYPDQNRYGNDRYGDGRNQNSLIGRVLADLNRAASNARVDGHERKHFETAADKLHEFEGRWAQGKFDGGKLDKAIQNLQNLVEANQVRGRDRDMLARDVADLRQFRSALSRNPANGYRDRYDADNDGRYNQDRYDQNRRYDPRYDPNWR